MKPLRAGETEHPAKLLQSFFVEELSPQSSFRLEMSHGLRFS